MKKVTKNIKEQVENWVRAEFHFRLGEYGSKDITGAQDALVKMERRLRRAVTGKGDLKEAGEKLGLKIEKARFPKAKKRKIK